MKYFWTKCTKYEYDSLFHLLLMELILTISQVHQYKHTIHYHFQA